MKSAEFHPDAAEEAREAVSYYEDIRVGLGTDFQAELEAWCDSSHLIDL